MASDRQQFHKARVRWNAMRTEGSLSEPATANAYAILLPYDHAKRSHTDSFPSMTTNAHRLASVILDRTGVDPVIAIDATLHDFEQVLIDPKITHIVTLGRGTLSSIESSEGLVTWTDIASGADHLKQGTFTQLQCGGTRKDLNPPFGMFAVSDQTNVRAHVGKYVPNRTSILRVMDSAKPVTDHNDLTYRQVKDDFLYSDKFGTVSEAIAAFDRFEAHIHHGTLVSALTKRIKRK